MKTLNKILFCSFFVVICTVCGAEEAVSDSPTSTFWDYAGGILSWSGFWDMLLKGGVFLIAFLMGKVHFESTKRAEAYQALKTGVISTYTQIITDANYAFKDKKIDSDEARRLRNNAIKIAKDQVGGPALALLTSWGEEKLHALVQQIVNREKNGGM